MKSLFHRLRDFVGIIQHSKSGLIGLAILTAALPLTVLVAQQRQDIQQRATNQTCINSCNQNSCAVKGCAGTRNTKLSEAEQEKNGKLTSAELEYGNCVAEYPDSERQCDTNRLRNKVRYTQEYQNKVNAINTEYNSCALTCTDDEQTAACLRTCEPVSTPIPSNTPTPMPSGDSRNCSSLSNQSSPIEYTCLDPALSNGWECNLSNTSLCSGGSVCCHRTRAATPTPQPSGTIFTCTDDAKDEFRCFNPNEDDRSGYTLSTNGVRHAWCQFNARFLSACYWKAKPAQPTATLTPERRGGAPGGGETSGQCSGSINFDCTANNPVALRGSWNVSPVAGPNTCNVYVVNDAGGVVQVSQDNACSGQFSLSNFGGQQFEKGKSYRLYGSNGQNPGTCFNKELEGKVAQCASSGDSPVATLPPPPGAQANPANPGGSGVGRDAGVCRDDPVGPPSGYKWIASCSVSGCTANSGCPENTIQRDKVNPVGSNWCYGFGSNGSNARCMQLRYVGGESSAAGACVISNQAPDLGVACAACVMQNASGLKEALVRDHREYASCNNQQLVNYWCNGGVGVGGVADCNTKKAMCSTVCGSTGTPGGLPPTATPASARASDSTRIPAPTNPRVSCNIDGSKIQLYISWREVEGSAGYALRVDQKEPSWRGDIKNPEDTVANSVTTTAYVVPDIIPGQPINWWVHAIDSRGVYSDLTYGQKITCNPTTVSPTVAVGPIRGDFNTDRKVDPLDMNICRDEIRGKVQTKKCDLNNDNAVTILDWSLWLDIYHSVQ